MILSSVFKQHMGSGSGEEIGDFFCLLVWLPEILFYCFALFLQIPSFPLHITGNPFFQLLVSVS